MHKLEEMSFAASYVTTNYYLHWWTLLWAYELFAAKQVTQFKTYPELYVVHLYSHKLWAHQYCRMLVSKLLSLWNIICLLINTVFHQSCILISGTQCVTVCACVIQVQCMVSNVAWAYAWKYDTITYSPAVCIWETKYQYVKYWFCSSVIYKFSKLLLCLSSLLLVGLWHRIKHWRRNYHKHKYGSKCRPT